MLSLIFACTAAPPPSSPGDDTPLPEAPGSPTAPTGATVPDPTTIPVEEPPRKNFTLALWMAADNDLEPSVPHDFDELERAMRDDVSIVVQVDGIAGYLPDWEGTKRFEIVADQADGVLASTEVADLGEVNMGDGAEFADFLLWANEAYPADHFAVLMWNHGGGFWIAADDTDHDELDIHGGELSAALDELIAVRGDKVDLISFDACNMAQWENVHALRDQVKAYAASQAWVGMEGYSYDEALASVEPGFDGLALGDALAWSAFENGEFTHSVVDVSLVDPLTEAVDALALAFLALPDGPERFLVAQEQARGLDVAYDDFWLDLGSLADESSYDDDPAVVTAALDVRAALEATTAEVYNADNLAFASGLTIYTDLYRPYLQKYAEGPWAEVTAWDELLYAAASL